MTAMAAAPDLEHLVRSSAPPGLRSRFFAAIRLCEIAAWLRASADADAGLVTRSLAAGEIIRVCRGLCCLDSLVIAARITGPSYVSLEAALIASPLKLLRSLRSQARLSL
jgi:hypothetical protein